LQIDQLTVHIANIEDNQKVHIKEVEKRGAEINRLRDLLKTEAEKFKEANHQLIIQLQDATDEVGALRQWRATNLDAMTAVGRRLEVLVVEKAELQEMLKLMRPKLEEAEKERTLYKEQNKQLSLALGDLTAKHSHPPSRRNSDNAVQPLDDSGRPLPTVAGNESEGIATPRSAAAERFVAALGSHNAEAVPTVLPVASGASKQTFPPQASRPATATAAQLAAGAPRPPPHPQGTNATATTPAPSLVSRWWNNK
jgi:hypothetical protein